MTKTQMQLVEIGDRLVAIKNATPDQVDDAENTEGLWTARGTVEVMTLAQARKAAQAR